MPKYRGQIEDWLDEESLRAGRISKKHVIKKSPKIHTALSLEEANATVVEVFPKQCRTQMDDGTEYLCSYRRASVFLSPRKSIPEGFREKAPVAVGDRVLIKVMNDLKAAIVVGVASRRNQLMRPLEEHEKLIHVIVSNIDLLCIVSSVAEPAFSPGLVDRFLIAAQLEAITPLLVINKMDLQDAKSQKPWALYQTQGLEIFELSAKSEMGVNSFLDRLRGNITVFCGHSGVGKTSLLNRLLGTPVGRTGKINPITGKGRHTTTGAILFNGPDNTNLIDTPGIREFGLFGLMPQDLSSYFQEFKGLQCAQRGCLHDLETDCDAKALPRYSSYIRILRTLEK